MSELMGPHHPPFQKRLHQHRTRRKQFKVTYVNVNPTSRIIFTSLKDSILNKKLKQLFANTIRKFSRTLMVKWITIRAKLIPDTMMTASAERYAKMRISFSFCCNRD